ncbi:MAG: hypothetical protein IKX19_06165, partial [Clostridia bacterium]|nr:hypothetical protein [Clostridia bacterium]
MFFIIKTSHHEVAENMETIRLNMDERLRSFHDSGMRHCDRSNRFRLPDNSPFRQHLTPQCLLCSEDTRSFRKGNYNTSRAVLQGCGTVCRKISRLHRPRGGA